MHSLGQIFFFFHFSVLSLLSLSGILIPGSYLQHYSIKVPLKPHYFISMVALGSTLTTLRLLQRAAFVFWCKYLLFPKTFCHDKLKWNINEQADYVEIWLTDDLVYTWAQASPLLCRGLAHGDIFRPSTTRMLNFPLDVWVYSPYNVPHK